MAMIIDMPKLSDTMVTGKIISWLKKEGEAVESGTAIAEVETDKATMELEVFEDGTLLKVLAQVEDAVPVGGPIAILGSPGEDVSGLIEHAQLSREGAGAETQAPAEETHQILASEANTSAPPQTRTPEHLTPQEQPAAQAAPSPAPSAVDQKMRVSPVAQRMAAEQGIDLSTVQGSGPAGRIVKRDIEQYLAAGAPQAAAQAVPAAQPTAVISGVEYEDVPLSSFRETVARRLAQSLGPVPHFFLEIDLDAEPMMQIKRDLQALAGETRLTLTDILIKACAVALQRIPEVNGQFMGNAIRRFKHSNIGIAVAGQGTLLVPVIQSCDIKSIGQIARERAGLVEKGQQGKLSANEMANGTFTISNLGMMGITRFKAVINPPQAAILAVGTVREEPVVKDGAVVPGKRMSLSLSCDHRVIDGAEGARFMAELKLILEHPLNIAL